MNLVLKIYKQINNESLSNSRFWIKITGFGNTDFQLN